MDDNDILLAGIHDRMYRAGIGDRRRDRGAGGAGVVLALLGGVGLLYYVATRDRHAAGARLNR
jgi:hypothetical protein